MRNFPAMKPGIYTAYKKADKLINIPRNMTRKKYYIMVIGWCDKCNVMKKVQNYERNMYVI